MKYRINQCLESIEELLTQLEVEKREALRTALAELLEALLPSQSPFEERRPDASALPMVQDLRTVVNRFRETAKKERS